MYSHYALFGRIELRSAAYYSNYIHLYHYSTAFTSTHTPVLARAPSSTILKVIDFIILKKEYIPKLKINIISRIESEWCKFTGYMQV